MRPEHERGKDDVPDVPDEMRLEHERGKDDVPDVPDEMRPEHERGKDDVPDVPDEMRPEHERGKELRNEERFAAYFALEVIRRRDGGFQTGDKQLIADMLNTSIRTIERVWNIAQEQITKGQRVDVSNKKKGRVGRKRIDLGLSRVPTIPLNKRRTIRSLAKALGVNRSTLYCRFQWGEDTTNAILRRYAQ
jgi:DNA invertase Pin-like site-specific DNA recombinase